MDEHEYRLDLDHDIMQFVDMGEEIGSEFELSEDGGSSVASSAEIKLEDLDYGIDYHGMPDYVYQQQMQQQQFQQYQQYQQQYPQGVPLQPNPLSSNQVPSGQHSAQSAQSAHPAQLAQLAPQQVAQHHSTNPSQSYQYPHHIPDQYPDSRGNWLDVPDTPQPTHSRSVSNPSSFAPQRPIFTASLNPRAQELMQVLQFGAKEDAKAADIPVPETHRASFDEICKEASSGQHQYSITIKDFPTRSRVETQIKCRLEIRPSSNSAASMPSLLHLPTDSIARPRFQLVDKDQTLNDARLSANTLWLGVDVVNPDSPHDQVLMCEKCLARERRRAFRKKTMDPHEETYWNKLESRRIIIFNCKEVMPLSNEGLAELPLRVACYCRHHAAKNGFKLILSLRDAKGEVVGRVISSNLFITDSHKDHHQHRELSKHHSVSSLTSMASSNSSAASVNSLSLNSPVSETGLHAANSSSNLMGKTVHPYMRPKSNGGVSSQLNRQIQTSQSVPSWVASVQKNEIHGIQPEPVMQSTPHVPNGTGPAVPVVFRAIPPSGSVRGGIDVTLLGQNLHSGLVVLFGDVPAVSTQCWSDSTIIAQLPPSSQPGPVPITFQNTPVDPSGPQSATFTYFNDGDDKLKEIALQMIGYKSTGKIEDASNIAQRILESGNNGGSNARQESPLNGSPNPEGMADNAEQFALWVLHNINKISGTAGTNVNLRNSEGQTMLHLAAMLGYASVTRALLKLGAYVDSQDVSGYSPLHFAVLCGNRNITRLLLMADADPFHRTRTGFVAQDIADSTVQDLLPTDQRAWYSELNRRGSSSSLVSLGREWQNDTLAPNDVLMPPQSVHTASEDESEPVALIRNPPPYSQLFPEDNAGQGKSKLRNRGTITREPIIDIEVSEADEDCDDGSSLDREAGGEVQTHYAIRWKDKLWRWKQEISNDKMLFTFWIPLAMATIVGICCLYVMQNYGSVNSHPMATFVGDFVKHCISLALDTVLPMQRHSQASGRQAGHHARA